MTFTEVVTNIFGTYFSDEVSTSNTTNKDHAEYVNYIIFKKYILYIKVGEKNFFSQVSANARLC